MSRTREIDLWKWQQDRKWKENKKICTRNYGHPICDIELLRTMDGTHDKTVFLAGNVYNMINNSICQQKTWANQARGMYVEVNESKDFRVVCGIAESDIAQKLV